MMIVWMDGSTRKNQEYHKTQLEGATSVVTPYPLVRVYSKNVLGPRLSCLRRVGLVALARHQSHPVPGSGPVLRAEMLLSIDCFVLKLAWLPAADWKGNMRAIFRLGPCAALMKAALDAALQQCIGAFRDGVISPNPNITA
jgi:hypothetical protein